MNPKYALSINSQMMATPIVNGISTAKYKMVKIL